MKTVIVRLLFSSHACSHALEPCLLQNLNYKFKKSYGDFRKSQLRKICSKKAFRTYVNKLFVSRAAFVLANIHTYLGYGVHQYDRTRMVISRIATSKNQIKLLVPGQTCDRICDLGKRIVRRTCTSSSHVLQLYL